MTIAASPTATTATDAAPAVAGLDAGRRRVLVAGIGNIFFGDDGFGVEVIDRVLRRPVPPGVAVADFGIRGLHLAYELLEGYDVVVLVDAMPLGEEPGTVVLVEAEVPAPATGTDDPQPAVDAHSMSPAVVLGTLAHLGGHVDRVLVVGCEPATVTDGIGLSEPVASAVDPAVDLIDAVLDEVLADPARPPGRPPGGPPEGPKEPT